MFPPEKPLNSGQKRLRKWLEDNGIHKVTVWANKINVDPPTLSKFLRGIYRSLGPKTALRIERETNRAVTIRDLLYPEEPE